MVVEDQRGVIEFLSSPSTHASRTDDTAGAPTVERIETHSAIVFLTGQRALKLKRAVRFDYLDFSTAAERRRMCEAEVRLNQRTAPSLYRGVVAVTRDEAGAFALNGPGQAVDWLVEMNRFDQRDLCDRRAADGSLDLATADRMAEAIARFHAAAEVRRDHGGSEAMTWVIDGNAQGFAEFGADVFDAASCTELTREMHAAVRQHHTLLDARRDQGRVRQCHGDLHLRNIVLLDGAPTLFDAVEFNDRLACIDTWYDIAFLLMDLLARRLPRHANVVLNRYLTESQDWQALPLLPFFLACRAAIRAKTSATAATLQSDARRREELRALARTYLASAARLLHPPAPTLLAIGGLSGSGKSSVAAALAPEIGAAPGALLLRSDEIRKEICGVSRSTRLGSDGYGRDVSERVYRTLADRATGSLRAGHSVVADAVYARRDDRIAIEQVAMRSGVPFVGLWLDAPEAVLLARVAARRDDPSDADANVVKMQVRERSGEIAWRRLDATAPLDEVVACARRQVGTTDPASCSR
jgi:aminoglycoside phosphotransferase family enzyme/predicted kinase